MNTRPQWHTLPDGEPCEAPSRGWDILTLGELVQRDREPHASLENEIRGTVRRWLDKHPAATQIDPALLRCDQCGEQADTVHWWPWATHPKQCLLACPRHDAGGYWISLDRMFTGPTDVRKPGRVYTPLHHLIDTKDVESVVLWISRLDEARRAS